MSGTVDGGKQAAQTLYKQHGADFYKRIGSLGGSAPKTKPFGFASMDKEKLSIIGQLGGSISRRGKGKNKLSLVDRKLIRNRHLAKHAELYRLSDEQVSKLSRRFK